MSQDTTYIDDKRRQIRALLTRLGPSLGLIVVWTLFAVLKGSSFSNWNNQRLMLLQTTVVATAAIGGTLVIASGGIDLSVGSGIALGTMLIAYLLKLGVDPTMAAAVSIAAGFGIGLATGTMIIGRIGRIVGGLLGVGVGYAAAKQYPCPLQSVLEFVASWRWHGWLTVCCNTSNSRPSS